MRDSIGQVLEEIGRYRLLTPDEEISLSRQVQEWLPVRNSTDPKHRRIIKRGKRAFERMAACNLRLVVHIAERYTYRCKSLELADLIQSGTIGLVRAVELFDATKGYKFSTYAYWWIRQSITRAIEEMDRMIRIPIHQNEKLAALAKARRKLGPDATDQDLMQHLGLNERQYKLLISAPVHVGSLDAVIGDDTSTLLDVIADDKPTSGSLESQGIQDLIECLPDRRAREVIKRRYGFAGGIGDSLQAIANDHGISRERVRQIQDRAEKQLRLIMSQRRPA